MAIEGGAIILAIIAAAPGTAALFTRRKAAMMRVAAGQQRTTIDEFNALFSEQRQRINSCQEECTKLATQRDQLETKVNVLEDELHDVERKLERERERRIFLEQVMRMRGMNVPNENGEPK